MGVYSCWTLQLALLVLGLLCDYESTEALSKGRSHAVLDLGISQAYLGSTRCGLYSPASSLPSDTASRLDSGTLLGLSGHAGKSDVVIPSLVGVVATAGQQQECVEPATVVSESELAIDYHGSSVSGPVEATKSQGRVYNPMPRDSGINAEQGNDGCGELIRVTSTDYAKSSDSNYSKTGSYGVSGPEGSLKASTHCKRGKTGRYSYVDVDSMLDEAFKTKPRPLNLCAMACRGKVKDQLIGRIIEVIDNIQQESIPQAHLLYVCLQPADVASFIGSYTDQLHKLGQWNVISGTRIVLTPGSHFTVTDASTLLRVYNVINGNRQRDPSSIMNALRASLAQTRSGPAGVASTSGEDYSSPLDQDVPSFDFYMGDEIGNDGNQVEFLSFLGKLLDGFMRPQEEVINRDWSNDTQLTMPREALGSMRSWFKRGYHSPEKLVTRLKLEEPHQGIAVLDGFEYMGPKGIEEGKTQFFDEILAILRSNCQLLALCPRLFSPQNVSQWLNKIHGPVEFVVSQKVPEVRLHYGSQFVAPLETESEPSYAAGYVSSMRSMLKSEYPDSVAFFNFSTCRARSIANMVWDEGIKLLIKGFIKEALELQGIDTLRKLRHSSRGTYDYIKKYIPGLSGSRLRPTRDKSAVAGKYDNNPEASSIDDVLDNLIDLDRSHFGSKLIGKCVRRGTIEMMKMKHLEKVLNLVVDTGIFPTVIYSRNNLGTQFYEGLLEGRFEPSEELNKRISEVELQKLAPVTLKNGVAVIYDSSHPDVISFVKNNIAMFKVIITDREMPTVRHHVLYGSLKSDTDQWNNRLMSNVQHANIWLGAERVTYYAIPPIDGLHALKSMLVHPEVDYSRYKPLSQLSQKRSIISKSITNEKLIEKLEMMTFDRYLLDCRDAYLGSASRARMEARCGPSTGTHLEPTRQIRKGGKWCNNAVALSSMGIAEGLECSGARRETNEAFEDPRKTTSTLEERSLPVGENGDWSESGGSPTVQSVEIIRPIIRTMLERREFLDKVEAKLRVANVDIQSFYLLDQRIKLARQFDRYLCSRINGTLSFKSKYIGEMADAVSLRGANVTACDGNKYTLVWVGNPQSVMPSKDYVSDEVLCAIRNLMPQGRWHSYFAILKRGEGSLVVPAYFIKDIESLPKAGTRVAGYMSKFRKAGVSVIRNPELPRIMLDVMPYMVLTNGESPAQYMLPCEMQLFNFLTAEQISLVKLSRDTWNHYRDRVRELMEDAVEKLLNSSDLQIRTREEARNLIYNAREVYSNKALRGLEPHLTERQAVNRSWGSMDTAETCDQKHLNC